jgi:hypothetical protein
MIKHVRLVSLAALALSMAACTPSNTTGDVSSSSSSMSIDASSVSSVNAMDDSSAGSIDDNDGNDDNGTMDEESSAEMETSSKGVTASAAMSATVSVGVTTSKAASSLAAQVQTISVTVTSWQYSPNVIHVKQGSKTTLHLIGEDGIHGFSVPDLGINVRIEPGTTVDVVIPSDKVGTFAARCSVPCGPGHGAMTATVIVE